MTALRRDEIDKLPVEERLRLVEDIWESIREHPEALPLTDAQREELDRRLSAHEADPGAAEDLESVLSRIRQKK
jgi:putative addiction module component (TIGR02574 family)